MKILQINTTFSRGGAGISADSIAMAVSDSNHIFTSICCDRPKIDHDNLCLSIIGVTRYFLNVLVYRVFGVEGYFNKRFWAPVVDRIQDFDIVHLHNVHGYYLPLDVLEAFLSKPCVWTLHDYWVCTGGPGSPLPAIQNRSLLERIFPFANLRYPAEWIDRSNARRRYIHLLLARFRPSLVAVSQDLADGLIAMGLRDANITVIPHGLFADDVAPSESDRFDARRRLGWPRDRYIFLFCASQVDNPLKGCSLFLNALASISSVRDWVAYVVGDEFANARREALGLKLANVHFCGSINQSGMDDVYRACNTYVSASISETFGRTVVEALAAGAIVVCSDLPVLRASSCGLASYFPCADLVALSTKLVDALESRLLPINQPAASAIRSKYALSTMAAKYRELYRSVISKH